MTEYKKINDLAPATILTDDMQLETDIGGATANKINLLQIKNYVHIDTAIETVEGNLVDNTDPSNPIVSQNLTISGDATGTNDGVDLDLILSSVNEDPGTFGNHLNIPIVTVDEKGRIIDISTTAISDLTVGNFLTHDVSQWTNDAGYITTSALTGLVPYTGAANNVNLGAHTLTAANVSGVNTGDISLTGENYISLIGQALTASAVNLSGSNATGILAAARFPALTGDLTTASGSLGTTLATVNSNIGQFGDSSNFPTFTVNAKGLMTGAVLMSFSDAMLQANGGTTSLSLKVRFGLRLTAQDFGAKGDGVTDDTGAIQAAVTYAQTNHVTIYFPSGRYLISAKINFKNSSGWGMQGSGTGVTTILQGTDNIPIWDLGIIPGTNMANYFVDGFTFDYVNNQPSTNTSATCILWSAMGFQGRLTNIEFGHGYYAMKVASGIGRPWGQTWDNIFFGRGLTGGCYDNSAGTNATPNNKWGRFGVDGTNMTNILFNITGYNGIIETLEFFTCPNSSQLINFGANSRFDIGCIKLETYSYTTAQFLINVATNSNINIGDIWIGGTGTIAPATGAVYLLGCQSGGTDYTRVKVKSILASATTMTANTGFLVSGGGTSTNGVEIGSINMSGGWQLQNNGSTVISNVLKVTDYVNNYVQINGDADLTITAGDANRQYFNTAFTASRTGNLPTNTNNLFNGLTYTFTLNGAINGANTFVIKAGAVTYATLTKDCSVTLAWKRQAGGSSNGDWVIISGGQLAASNLTNGTTGSGAIVLATSPTLVTPILGTPTSGTLTSCTGLPVTTGISGLGTNIATFLATPSSSNLASALTDKTGTGLNVFATSPTLVTPILGIPTSGTLTNCTGLPIGGVSGLGIGIATFLATPTSANLASALTDETGTGSAVFGTNPVITQPTIVGRVNPQTGTTYTLVATDFQGGVTANNASAQTYTLPQQSTLVTVAGEATWIENIGTAPVTLVKEGSEVLLGNTTIAPGATAWIRRDTTTTWSVFGGTAIVNMPGWNWFIQTVANNTYTMVAYAGCDGTLLGIAEKARTITTAGTFAIAINGSNVTGLTAIVPTTAGSYSSASAANTFVRGNPITITYSGTTLVVDHSLLLDITKQF